MWISFFSRLRTFVPAPKSLLLVAISGALGAGLMIGVPSCRELIDPAKPEPQPALDARFIPLGRGYLPELAKVYAVAWEKGATELESGLPVSTALLSVARSWEAGRSQLLNRLITPEFTKIVPEGKPDSELSRAELAALARAWRGFAAGLISTSKWPWVARRSALIAAEDRYEQRRFNP